MDRAEPDTSRVETVVAALIYLMTHYARTGCPKVAMCVSRHMQCLAAHPQAAAVLREVCTSAQEIWDPAGSTKGRMH